MPESSRDRLLQQFRELVGERLEKVTRSLMELENAPNTESGKSALRELHGLKGEARMMGFPGVTRVVHEMEELLRAAEEGSYNLTGGSTDALLAAADAVMVLSGALAGSPALPDVNKLLEWLAQRATAERALRPSLKAPEQAAQSFAPAQSAQSPAVVDGAGVLPAPRESGVLPPVVDGAAEKPSTPRPPATTREPHDAAPDVSRGMNRAAQEGANIRISQKSLDVLTSAVADLSQLSRRRELAVAKRLELSRELSLMARMAEDLGPSVAPLAARLSRAKELAAQLHREDKLTANEELRDLSELGEEVQAIRMVPLSTLFEPYPRMVRELARELGKEVELVIEGESTRADRSVIDTLRDPLLHLVRNALDHGIEPPPSRVAAGKPARGKLLLHASREGERLLLRVQDDGAGLDPAQLRKLAVQRGLHDEAAVAALSEEAVRDLIFVSGFTTKQVATELSGRGIGLDVVRVRLQGLGGDVLVSSSPGRGIQFELRVPVSLTVAPLLFIKAGEERLCITAAHVSQALRLEGGQMAEVGGHPAVRVGEELFSYASIDSLLGMGPERQPESGELVLLIRGQGSLAAISVDRVLEERVQPVLPLKGLLSHFPHLTGATPNPDGSVSLVLSAPHLAAAARAHALPRAPAPPRSLSPQRRKRKILVVDDSPLTRDLLCSLLEAVGYEVVSAADGLQGLERAAREGVDLVVSDLEMPNLDGLALTRRLKAHATLSRLPVVIVTTRGSEEDRRRGLAAGADGYIAKGDVVRKELVEVIARLLG